MPTYIYVCVCIHLIVIEITFNCVFTGGSGGKESTCSEGDLGLIPVLGRSPGGGHGNPLQYSCLENRHGQRSLVGYSLWGLKKSDTTERLSTHAHYYMSTELIAFNLHRNLTVESVRDSIL